MSRIVLAMSGGVDSSVAAQMLRTQGHDVIGVFMRHGQTLEMACATPTSNAGAAIGASQKTAKHDPLQIVTARSDHKQGCCTSTDAADARRVADKLDIPFYALDFTDAFNDIIDYFVSEYSVARTPNPCIMCNNWIKFGRLFAYADSIGAEFVATGHYARTGIGQDGNPALLRGLDDDKDQSYVLFGVRRELLPRMMFPVGEFRKPEIRQMATEVGMRVADKKDSQEICFVSAGQHADFIRKRRDAHDQSLDTSGKIVMVDGRVVGTHLGIEGYTIGQRKGLGVALGEPHYVVKIDAQTNQVVLGRKEDLERTTLTASKVNWLVESPATKLPARVQIRYNSAAHPATVTQIEADRCQVEFDGPVHGVAPGQAAVFYDADRVLGGGWID